MKIAVVGAGIAGLTCAYELQQAGHEVTVFEKNDYVGGRMSSRFQDRFYFDIGADHLGNSFNQMKHYCNELGVGWEKMIEPLYGVYRGGKIYHPYKVVNWATQIRFGVFARNLKNDTDFFDASTAIKYDDDTAYNYLAKTISKEASEYLANPMCSGYQFHNSDEMSKGALIAYMQSVKHNDWTLHHLKGGMISLPNALAKKLNVKLGVAVEEVIPGDKVKISYASTSEKFDLAVLASTANVTEKILADQSPAQKNLFAKTEYAPTISVSYLIDANLLPKQTVVFSPFIESQTISAYTSQKMKGEEMTHNGKSMICAWLHQDFAKEIFDLPNEVILECCKKELDKVTPWLTDINALEPHDLERWTHAMPKFKQGHLIMVKEYLEKEQGKNNIYLAGDYLNAPWTEGALRCGQRVARRIGEKSN